MTARDDLFYACPDCREPAGFPCLTGCANPSGGRGKHSVMPTAPVSPWPVRCCPYDGTLLTEGGPVIYQCTCCHRDVQAGCASPSPKRAAGSGAMAHPVPPVSRCGLTGGAS